MSRASLARPAFLTGMLLAATSSVAGPLPLLQPGDARVRHAVQLAVDAGRIPLGTAWPITSTDLPKDAGETYRPTLMPGDSTDGGWYLRAAENPGRLRSFADTAREAGEIGVQAGWAAGDYAGGAFRVGYAFDPEDDRHWRLDGTYVAWRAANWWLSAGMIDRWWGPGQDGSLILTNNARPTISLGIDRASAKAPEWGWLKWVGPYRWSTFMGRLEEDHSGFPNPLLWGARLTFAPFDVGLEIGFSRTAQWCRPGLCDLDTFADVLLGRDNQGENVAAEDEPGNQLAGYDVRWRVPRTNLALYWQSNGEAIDNGNYRPRILTHIVGVEFWSSEPGAGGWRGFVEYADTTCGSFDVLSSDPARFECAYENGIFTDGYRTRGRVIGHPADRDSRIATLGGLYVDGASRTWEARLRRAELNRGATASPSPSHTVVPVATDLWNAELRVEGAWRTVRYGLGVGVDWSEPVGGDDEWDGRAMLHVTAPWGR